MSLIHATPTQGSIAQGTRVSGGEMDVLTALGQQLEISPELLEQNPELAKLLGENPENLDFKTLLGKAEGQEGKSVVDPELLAKAKNALGELDEKALEIGKDVKSQNPNQSSILLDPKKQEQRVLSPYEVSRNNEEKALNSTKSIFAKPEVSAQQTKMATTEEASRAFVPERKSMFAINKQQVQPETKPEATKGLMDLNEFVAKQSSGRKQNFTNANANPYKAAQAESMFAKNIEADAPKMTQIQTAESAPMKVQDLMLMNNSEKGSESGMEFSSQSGQQTATQIASSVAAGKTFDISQLTGATNQSDVITQIQDYVIQARVSKEPTMQMSFEHKDLGMVDLTVAKDGNQVSVMINAHSQEGSKFFNQNRGELLQTLSQAGISVSEFKLDSNNTNNNQNNSNHSSNHPGGKQEHAGSEQGQRKQDSERREELWNLLNDKEAA